MLKLLQGPGAGGVGGSGGEAARAVAAAGLVAGKRAGAAGARRDGRREGQRDGRMGAGRGWREPAPTRRRGCQAETPPEEVSWRLLFTKPPGSGSVPEGVGAEKGSGSRCVSPQSPGSATAEP